MSSLYLLISMRKYFNTLNLYTLKALLSKNCFYFFFFSSSVMKKFQTFLECHAIGINSSLIIF